MLKSGIRTTEFWLTVLVAVAGLVLIGLGAVKDNEALVYTGAALLVGPQAAYSLARGVAKKGAPGFAGLLPEIGQLVQNAAQDPAVQAALAQLSQNIATTATGGGAATAPVTGAGEEASHPPAGATQVSGDVAGVDNLLKNS